RSRQAVVSGLDPGYFENDLAVEVEQVLESERAAVRVVRGGVDRRIAGQSVSLEVDAGVLQHAARVGGARQRLRALEAGEKVKVGNEGQWIDRRVIAPDERILQKEQHAVRGLHRRFLAEV